MLLSDGSYFVLSKNNGLFVGISNLMNFGGFLAFWDTPQLYPLEGSSPPKVASSNAFPAPRTPPLPGDLSSCSPGDRGVTHSCSRRSLKFIISTITPMFPCAAEHRSCLR